MREFWRIFIWGLTAAAALIIAIYAGLTDAGVGRARHAALQLREAVMPSSINPARPLDAIEGRKLAETVRVLAADRERLIARIAALEHNIDDITSSITRTEQALRPAPPPAEPALPPAQLALPAAEPAPRPAEPAPRPMMSTVPQTAAPTNPSGDDVTSSVGNPGPPPSESETQIVPDHIPRNPVTKRQFGLDLGSAPSEDALRPLWMNALRRHGALIQNLRPMTLTREHPRGGGVEYRLIAGPIANAAKAARFCAAITATGGICQPTTYEAPRLAIR